MAATAIPARVERVTIVASFSPREIKSLADHASDRSCDPRLKAAKKVAKEIAKGIAKGMAKGIGKKIAKKMANGRGEWPMEEI